MSNVPTKAPTPAVFWILFCAYFNCVGWILSAFHQLNTTGYLAAVGVGLVLSCLWWKGGNGSTLDAFRWAKLKRRFARPFAMAFLILAGLAFIGGAIHAPTNYDALAYRVPRVLNWLAEGQWHWIHTEFQRLNSRAVGFEWVSAPFMALSKSDRLLFLINSACFFILPGLVYGVFTRLGVKARAAWHWMWIVPTGYCFLLQAGSIGNDLYGAVMALAAVDFALRAKTTRRASDVWISCLAAALLSSSKTSNLPMLLPWAVAVLPGLPLLVKRPVATVAVAMVSITASFLPMAALNWKQCGDWTGLATEDWQTNKQSPFFFVRHNTFLLTIQNFVPPVFPVANVWNKTVVKFISPELQKKLDTNFEPMGAHLAVGEMIIEEDAGLGLGVCVLVVLSLLIGLKHRRVSKSNNVVDKYYRLAVATSPFISLLVFMAKSGLTTAARLVAPYYALLLPIFLSGNANAQMVRNKWWRRMAMLMFFVAGVMVIVSPARPLWPAQTILSKLDHGSGLIKRARSVYTVYGQRSSGFAPVQPRLPADANILGFISFDDPETSLWKPFGSRRIKHVLAKDTREDLQKRGIKYVLVSSQQFALHFGETFEQWMTRMNAEQKQVIPLTLRASRGSTDWYLVELRPGETAKK